MEQLRRFRDVGSEAKCAGPKTGGASYGGGVRVLTLDSAKWASAALAEYK